MAQISVTINGRSFRMACDDGEEERLLGLAKRFDESIDMLRGSFGEIGDLRLTVMAGIMAMDQMAEKERKLKVLEEDLAKTKVQFEEDLKRQSEKLDAEIAQLKRENNAHGEISARREELMSSKLNEVAVKIEELAESLAGVPKEEVEVS
ncbi:cell division protein ZapA [Flexibacterium corallicola]|uniref:cell division protein ZapA n=1 Tax=Flexibacterium corallicola TaxID=3037259 RepID=UPI00286EC72A|nr:cell division protein ZapA [Pseudovibrio sp. M1P-2-3]